MTDERDNQAWFLKENCKIIIHIVWTGKNWGVKKEGNKRCWIVFSDLDDAFYHGREILKEEKGVMITHAKDGRVLSLYHTLVLEE